MISVEVKTLHQDPPPKEVVLRMSPEEARHLHKRLRELINRTSAYDEAVVISRLVDAMTSAGIHTA